MGAIPALVVIPPIPLKKGDFLDLSIKLYFSNILLVAVFDRQEDFAVYNSKLPE
jgi:hypothetical protein